VSEPATAKIFIHGRSQAVRLPKAFRLPGSEVRGVLLEPIETTDEDVRALLAALDGYRRIPFMEDGRLQPPMPPADDLALD
jgi:antitoxin VapB